MNCAIVLLFRDAVLTRARANLSQVKHQLPELQQLIVQANFEQLLAVFQQSQQSRRR